MPRARSLLARVQQQGIEDNLLLYYLRIIPADGGSDTVFSNQKEVNEAMKEGERMFAAGDYKAAINSYTRAMLLDPNLYSAVLFIGDSYFADKQYGSAGEWFLRATQLDPNRETAYRYWGDALMRMGNLNEARSRFIDAIVAEPYERQAWVGLKQWADANKVLVAHPDIHQQTSFTEAEPGKMNINLDPASFKSKDGSNAWMFYGISRAAWHEICSRRSFQKRRNTGIRFVKKPMP